jgi:hypothetical protein
MLCGGVFDQLLIGRQSGNDLAVDCGYRATFDNGKKTPFSSINAVRYDYKFR